MGFTLVSKKKSASSLEKDQSGVALFMVLAAISVLAILVTEFTYLSQVNQMIAFGGFDQLKVHYLAKSGFKLSLLRLKAYQQVKGFLQNNPAGAAAAQAIPPGLIQKIWSFPFFYPLPTTLPGMSASDKEVINKFQKNSNLEGSYSAVVESESAKFNLNTILSSYSPTPSPSPSASPNSNPQPVPTPGAVTSTVDPQQARESLYLFIQQLLQNRFETDPDFAANYRDLRLNDLVDQIITWADRSYERTTPVSLDKVPMKRAPFYSVSELHNIPLMDDELYQFLAPNFTVSTTPGININTMQESTLRAIIPQITRDEVTAFFKYRDSEEFDNHFKNKKDFYEYLIKFVGAFRAGQSAIDELETNFKKRNIQLVTDETEFKITIQAQLNQASERIEAWVTLDSGGQTNVSTSNNPNATPTPPDQTTNSSQQTTGTTNVPPDIGLRINFMKIL